MSLTTTTHLNFTGQARAALEFYQSVFGGHLTIATYADFGMPKDAPGADGVVFGSVVADNGFRVMAYDIPGRAPAPAGSAEVTTRRENGTTITSEPFFLAVEGASLEEVETHWAQLAVDATVIEPLAASAWSAGFGMLADRFDVTWTFSVARPQA
ncbi:VOC family protein [Kineosporia babensis]|uniref:VOC family protein n=1 Tax=Kineosporia babensis TaxID=499548 RepID=A0A9X1STA6_9ACTN|nr:VOC family protein [Kineosporia babensis]MCD5311126.1 VOC family protein [Kineosporia babensis]